MIAHVGGRYADLHYAHDGRVERSVEVHSSWGTFEWLLHDAFDKGFRVGVVCHSDDHKGRPGATRPGASTFGAIGGLSCYFMPELTRDALFEALRKRRHYGTTGSRIFLDVRGAFAGDVTGFSEDPQFGPTDEHRTREASMGDIIRAGSVPMKLSAEVIGTAPVERLDVLHGRDVVQTARPFVAGDLGRRVRVLWQGAEYRGRGREVIWQGKLALSGNRFDRFAEVNFLNPERRVQETSPGTALAWTSVTTGNLAGIDLWLDRGQELARSRSKPMWCRVKSILPRSPTTRSHSTAADWRESSASTACPKTTGAAASRWIIPCCSRAPPICPSMCGSRRPTATRRGPARST